MSVTTALILMALSAIGGATIGVFLMAAACASGQHRTAQDDNEQARWLTTSYEEHA